MVSKMKVSLKKTSPTMYSGELNEKEVLSPMAWAAYQAKEAAKKVSLKNKPYVPAPTGIAATKKVLADALTKLKKQVAKPPVGKPSLDDYKPTVFEITLPLANTTKPITDQYVGVDVDGAINWLSKTSIISFEVDEENKTVHIKMPVAYAEKRKLA